MRSYYSAALPLLLLASWTTHSTSFSVNKLGAQQSVQRTASVYRPSSSLIRADSLSGEEPNGAAPNGGLPPNLVDMDVFVAALETLQEGTASSEAAKVKADKEAFYVIGKLRVNLNIDTAPGLDLAESTGLVLVSGTSGNAEDAGIQIGDTITSVFAANDSFEESTKAMNLEDTAQILMTAARLALESGKGEIDLELNRLIKCRYAD
jgi:hypothetical protein